MQPSNTSNLPLNNNDHLSKPAQCQQAVSPFGSNTNTAVPGPPAPANVKCAATALLGIPPSSVAPNALNKNVLVVPVTRPPRNSQLGVVPNERLELVKIQSNSPAFKHLHIGDRILLVNNKAVATQDELLAAMQSTDSPQLLFTVKRDVHKMVSLPPNREHLVVRHAGFDYPVVDLKWSRAVNKRVGLHVKEICNKVLVARTDENTAAADCLKAGDRIVDVNGTPVTCRKAVKDLICDSLASTSTASMIIERPNNFNTFNDIMRQIDQKAADKALDGQNDEPVLPLDCVLLVTKELQRRTTPTFTLKAAGWPRSQLKGAPVHKTTTSHPKVGCPTRRSVQLTSKVNTVPIAQDTDPKKYLRQVGRRHS